MSENEELLRLADDATPFDLPVGVYVVTKDGRFVKCNRQARVIFRLPLEGEIDDSIARFYRDPAKRDEMHRELLEREAQGQHLEKLIPIEVNGREIFVRDISRTLRGKNDEVLGYVCCITDVTEGERSNRLLNSLPAGVYKLDADDRCEQANWAFARLLGYASPEEIAGVPSSTFYVNPVDAVKLRQMVEAQHPEPVINFITELRKKDGGETIFANINAHMVEGEDGSYAGREGTIIDVTREEHYYRILRDVPVGLNVIRQKGEAAVIEHCNEEFLRIFGFTDQNHAKGYDVRKLHASPAEYARFKSELETTARRGKALIGHRLKVVTVSKEPEERTIEISSQPQLDSDGNLIGRTNAMRDITQEAELRDRLDELTFDIGSVLHNYTTTLLMVQLSSEPLLRSLGPDPLPFHTEVTPDQANKVVAAPAAQLVKALSKLLTLAKDEGRAPALTADQWARLDVLLALLRGYEEEVAEIDTRPVVLNETALEIIGFCASLNRSHKFAREDVNALRDAAQGLVRITNLISLHLMRDAVFEMDHQVRSLREFVTTNAREQEEKEICLVEGLIKQVWRNLDDYARSRRVKFKIEHKAAKVRVVRREVLRALADILHNAIKYSWSRDREKTKAPWITIRTLIVGDHVHVEFENWGVPIKKEEIEERLIFKIGYRGLCSDDRGRIGTGIGLADASRVARAQGGDVLVESHPAVGSWPEDDYNNPFLTTVTMKLPLYRD